MQYFYKSSLLSLLLISLCTSAQDILWEKSLGGKQADYLFDAIPTPDYGFILAGSSLSSKGGSKSEDSKGNYDYWIWKMNENGGLEWQKSYGGLKDDYLQSVSLTNDGGFILAGTSNSSIGGDKRDSDKGETDFWIIKLDAKGNETWQRTIGGSGQEKLHSIRPTKDGGYIIGGTSNSKKTPKDKKGKEDELGKKEDSRGNLDYWIIKTNSLGDIEWQKTFGGIYIDELQSVEQTKDGGYIIGGYSNSITSGEKIENGYGDNDFWIIKTNSKGEIIWQKTIGGNKDDSLYSLVQTEDGGFVLGGSSNSDATNSKNKANGKGTDFWIVKLDEIGTIIWQETYDFGKLDVLTSIVDNKDGTYLIGGYAQSEKSKIQNSGVLSKIGGDKEGINDYVALKINNKGEELWSKTVGSKGDEALIKLFETRDGGYLFAGTSDGEASRDKGKAIGNNDFWIVKLKDKTKKEKIKIDVEAYPNPAENYTNALVNYDYSSGWATLYDLNGRQLQKIELHGEHTIPIQLGNIPQGVYIVNIKTDNGEENALKIIKK